MNNSDETIAILYHIELRASYHINDSSFKFSAWSKYEIIELIKEIFIHYYHLEKIKLSE